MKEPVSHYTRLHAELNVLVVSLHTLHAIPNVAQVPDGAWVAKSTVEVKRTWHQKPYR